MERHGVEGETPVHENLIQPSEIQSTPGHVKPWRKQGGPPSKAKYYSVTDSELVP